MKAKFYVLPVITLALASFWLIKQRQTISTVEGKSTEFEKQIAAVRSPSPGADLTPTPPTAPAMKEVAAQAEIQTDKEPLNWKNIALQWEAMQQNTDATEVSLLRQRFKLMSPAELVAALEEVATHNLSALTRMDLMMHLIIPLVEKSPELALTHQMDFLGDNTFGMGWQLADVTQKWAKNDPARAAAWFAEQLAAGKLDGKTLSGKSETRSKITQALMSGLHVANPDAASRFLAAMDEGERALWAEKNK